MKFEIVEDGGNNQHLPDFARSPGSGMLGSGLRHLGIVYDGEVVATVWNHHDSTRAMILAESIAALLNGSSSASSPTKEKE